LLYLFLIGLGLLQICNTRAQENPEDSLIQVLENTSNDADRKEIYLQLARSQRSIDREKSIQYYTAALELEGNDFKRAAILDTLGLYNWQSGKYQEALDHFHKAYVIFGELQDSAWLGKVSNNIAVVNYGLGNRNEALQYYHISLKIRRNLQDSIGVATIFNNIGMIFQDWNLNDEALIWHKEALQIALELKDPKLIAYSYSNIGKCHENETEYEIALDYYNRGFNIYANEKHNRYSYAFFLANIGSVYGKMGIRDSALKYYHQSLLYAKRINNTYRIAIAEHMLGKNLLAIKELDSASMYVQSSYQNSLQNKYTELIMDNLFILAEIEEEQGNIPKSYRYFKNASQLKDSIFNNVEIKKFTELQVQYSQEQKEQENILLRKNINIQELIIQKQKAIRKILIAGTLLILLILVLILQSRASFKKLNKKLQNSEKDLKESNANKDKFFSIISHDLKGPFHVLIGIADLLYTRYDRLPAEKIKKHLLLIKNTSSNAYSMVQELLQWALSQTGKMKYEFEDIDLYLISRVVTEFLNSSAQSKEISIENKIAENSIINADKKAVETIIRNLVANAIKFTEPGGKILLEAKYKANEIAISITDTGIGMNQKVKDSLFKIEDQHSTPGTNNEIGTGLGLILCKEFVENQGGKIWAISEEGQGSKFVFTIPVQR